MKNVRQSGMTLLEVMIAGAITTAMMALALSMMSMGVRMARQGEQTVSSNLASRNGMEMLLRDLRGAGVPGGIYVSDAAGPPVMIKPVFTEAGANGVDNLWIIVPKPRAMQGNCTTVGSGAVVTQNGTGVLNVNCTTPFLPTDTLLVTNFKSGALLSGLALTANTISYTQVAAAFTGVPVQPFSNNPTKGGFLRGDQIYPVDLIRYSIRPNAVHGRPELVRQHGQISGGVSLATPFTVPAVAPAGLPTQVFPDVEDLQVAFGTGLPPNLTFASGHGARICPTIPSPSLCQLVDPAAVPLSVRVSVVGITPNPVRDDRNVLMPFGPLTVEDHVPPVPAIAGAPPGSDGFRRSLFRRRVELLNMGAVNL